MMIRLERSHYDTALSVIDRINQATTSDAALDLFQNAIADLGAPYFGIHFLPRPAGTLDDMCIACRVPPEWRTLYAERNFCQFDPSIRHSRQTALPFDWASAPYDPETEPAAKEVVDRARDFDVHKGILVPIPSTCGVVGGVWAAGPHFDDREIFSPILQLLGLHVFHRVEQLSRKRADRLSRLAPRECEVLAWCAKGKTPWEIACILGLSVRIVEWYLFQACKKLGAANPTQAIALWGGARKLEPIIRFSLAVVSASGIIDRLQ
jgi:DNA-binding CsgD family transcriptional regulator